MSSSRYYSNYYNAGPYRSKSSYNNYYSKPSNRPTYSYQPTAQSSTKSPKSKARTSRISDSGRIPGPYSPTLGRKKPVGTWKAKKKEEEERKTRQGEYSAESIEQELAKYQKGTFYFQEELLTDDKTKSKRKKGKAKTSMNGHKSSNNETADRFSKFGLLKTAEPAPQVVEKVDELPGAGKDDKSASNDKASQDDDTKESSSKSKKGSSSSEKKKDSKKEVAEDTKRKSSKKSSSSSSRTKSKKKKSTTRIQQIVTVSPNRAPGAFAAPPPDYYYPGYNYGAPPPTTTYTPYEYGGIAPPIDPYAPLPTGYAYNPYNATLPPPPPTSTNPNDPYYAPYPQYKPGFYADNLWYPYTGTTYVPQTTVAGLSQDPYSTPKQSKRSKKSRDSANVDLTTPLNDDKSNGIKKAKMSPGRRVNKIQKQLEYYFSVENLSQDEFLREAMDKEGWVSIDTLLGFNRMKVLGATKELVAEAAFHSQIIEIEAKEQNKIRMSKYWKQYVAKRKERSRDKKKSKRKSSSRALREKEKQLDAAEVNEQTIDAIVAGIEQKMERRKKRREQREREKKKKKENENEAEKKDNDDKDKKKDDKNDNDGSDKENNKENKPKSNKDDDNDNNDQIEEENVQELIKKDKEQNEDDKGDPEHNDMVEID